ncbi:MAG: nickel-dependent lactate racemase [Bacillota bacterium]
MTLHVPDDLPVEIVERPQVSPDSARGGSQLSQHWSSLGVKMGGSLGVQRDGGQLDVSRETGSSDLERVAWALKHPIGRSVEAVAAELSHASVCRTSEAKTTVAIAVSDSTRPVPNDAILCPLLVHLEECGFRQSQIKIIVGCGKHRPLCEDEAKSLVGPGVLRDAQFVVHCANQSETTFLGTTSRGTPVNVNKDFSQADLRIVTGMIEPHQFAGFSGGGKGVVIGLGNESTISHNHSMLLQDGARIGVFEGNPVREDIEEGSRLVGVHFVVNVVLGPDKRILRAFAGSYPEAYIEGVGFARGVFSVPFRSLSDIVAVSCGGHPKDINLYQAQKALAHVEPLVKPGGVIILLAECAEGIGDEQFERWMREARSPWDVAQRFREQGFHLGAHKAFLLARTMLKAKIFLVSSLSDNLAEALGFEPYPSVNEAFRSALTRCRGTATVSVVPQGTGMILVGGRRDTKTC